jgi:hypothetical protein
MDTARVGIIFGGKSAEHEVSLQSAKNILAALDRERFEPVLIGIDKQGQWHLSHADYLLHADDPSRIALHRRPVAGGAPGAEQAQLRLLDGGARWRSTWCCRSCTAARGRCAAGPAAHRQPALRRLRRTGLGGGDGQGRDQAPAARCRPAVAPSPACRSAATWMAMR